MHRGSAALLGRRSVLLLLFPVLSCCIVVFSVDLWWIGAFYCAALLRCVALLCCVVSPADLWRFGVTCGSSMAFVLIFGWYGAIDGIGWLG
ncbi:hypothetical protein GOP47_0007001 [Adiantum capillus-veneris]|uniref:Uncharacterized protein n=1 Tax=Adiantum capillus-veneris TaxID=13818 RepID=A0A9D4V0P3_ADICA|nr:hypothetical protein GOP47_0007001 [Adiantum capillus-veneris]